MLPLHFWGILLFQAAVVKSQSGSLHEWTITIKREDTKYQLAGVKHVGGILRIMPFIRYHTTCARQCMLHPQCKSFNFCPKLRICELNSESHETQPQNFVPGEGYEYYDKSWFHVDPLALGACQRKQCPHGSICLESCDRDGFSFAECTCLRSKKLKSTCKKRDQAVWGEWGEWSMCTKTCGLGLMNRQRQCMHPTVMGLEISNDNCEGLFSDVVVCDKGKCPAWKPWGDWSVCSSHYKCGEGIRERNRTCEGGTPGVDDLCTGGVTENENCYGQDCFSAVRIVGSENYGEGRVEVYNSLDGAWGGICADGWDINGASVACRQALNLEGAKKVASGDTFGELLYPLMLTGVKCDGTEESVQGCQHRGWKPDDVTCSKGAAGAECIVDGAWSEWSAWSDCSVSCDWGFAQRQRTCSHPQPLHGGKECADRPVQRKKCYLKICPIDGVWMSWSSWGGCSLTCGVGLRYRNRTCDGPYYDGLPCPTDPQGEIGVAECNTQRCPFRNCEEYKVVDHTNRSGEYLVDSDGPGTLDAFYVHCDMKTGVTVLKHDFLDRTIVNGYESRGEYIAELKYTNATMPHAEALVDSSENCKTYVRWECQSASIHEPEHTYEENKTLTLTYVTGRASRELQYFPGGDPNKFGCACDKNSSCHDPRRWCNCDANVEDEIMEDAGFVDVKKDLPLTGFYAGDTGATWEKGWHTIGPLICEGSVRKLKFGQDHPMEMLGPTAAPEFQYADPYH